MDLIEAKLQRQKFPLASAYLNFWALIDWKCKKTIKPLFVRVQISELSNYIVSQITLRLEKHIPTPYDPKTNRS